MRPQIKIVLKDIRETGTERGTYDYCKTGLL